jgi:enamine deaminase RidA (YjgF/YER057c/UK114 family)
VRGRLTAEPWAAHDGTEEYHMVVRPEEYATIATQLAWLERAYHEALAAAGLPPDSAVWRRFFFSDLPNQAGVGASQPFSNPHQPECPCAVSWICQPPLSPAKIMLWAYHVRDPAGPLVKKRMGSSLMLTRGALTHQWTTGLACPSAETSREQTRRILEDYTAGLGSHGMSLAEHVQRTWFFVQNIDANYQGLVTARREFFARHGLTKDTHFIASTGVEGAAADVAATITLDAYAIAGLLPAQVRHLAAPEHLSPTHLYGVTFERGTALAYRDRTQILISGTASINPRGEIMHPGDVARQLERMLENVAALLRAAGAGFDDVGVFIVYVRDAHDLEYVQHHMHGLFPHTPIAPVVARVCRPGWLVEIEALAIVQATQPQLPAY